MLVQRLGDKNQKDSNYLNELMAAIKNNPGCCDEVWLTTDYGYPTIEKHKQSANALMGAVKFFRENNITVSMQLANTLGHGEYMAAKDCSGLVYEGSHVGKMVDINGGVNDYSFCYNDNIFREYVKESLLAYKCVEPKKLWIDDDYRFFHHGSIDIGCFCDNCIKKFNAINGTSYTREQLSVLFMKDEKVRKLYADFMADSLADFTRYILKPFHEACPQTIFCLQYGDMKTALTANFNKVLIAMKEVSGFAPQTRPGGGVYEDYNPNLIVRGMLHANFLNSLLPDFVEEIMPEIENLPDVVYGKSPAGTCFTTSLYFAGTSSTDMTYSMLMRTHEPMSYHEKILKEFSRHRPYWERLVETNKATIQSGLNFVFAENTMRETEKHPFNHVNDFHIGVYDGVMEFIRTGIPIAFDGKKQNGVYFVTKENAHFLSNEQMEFLLTKPVVCDAEVFMAVNEKFRAFNCDYAQVDDATALKLYCQFTNSKYNGEHINKKYPKSFYSPKLYRSVNYQDKKGVEPVSFYGSEAKNITAACDGEYPFGVSDAVVTSKFGAKWLVCGTDLLNPTISADRRNQLLGVIDKICPNAIKTVIAATCQISLMPREDKNKKIKSVSLMNMTIGESGEQVLKIKNPAGNKFIFMSQYATERQLVAEKNGDEVVLVVPSLPAWSVGTIFVE